MEDTNEYKNLDMQQTRFVNKHWFISSALLFLVAATIYLAYVPNKYKVQTRILVNDNSLNAESVADHIYSKEFIQQALDELPFQVSYYQDGTFKKTELYGDSLPVKFVFSKTTSVDSGATAKITILSNQVYEIERNKVAQDFYFDKPIDFSFAKFKTVKGPNFKGQPGEIALKFNDPNELLEYYYSKLNVKPVDSKYIDLSIVTSIPDKGVDFLNKLVEVYNKANTAKAPITALANNDVNDRIQTVKDRLSTLKADISKFKEQQKSITVVKQKTIPIKKTSNAETAIQLTVLDAINPYVKRPVNQFIQIPYGDETGSKDLETAINEFNKTELAKQRLLQDSEVNRAKISSFNIQIAEMKMSIQQKIDAERNEISGIKSVASAPGNSTAAKANYADSISRVDALIRSTQQEYTNLLHNKPVKVFSTAAIKPVLTVIEKPGETITTYPQPALVYFLALLIGLAVPLPFVFLRRIQLPKNNLIDLKKFNARIYELLHAKEID